jgi:Phage integrase family
MRQKNKTKRRSPKTALRLPDLDHSKSSVLQTLGSAASQKTYAFDIDDFIGWYCSEPRLAFGRTVVLRYRYHLGARQLGHVRTVPVPNWVKDALDAWLAIAGIVTGIIFRCVSKTGSVWGNHLSEKAVWWMVREYAKLAGIDHLAPHDLRRTCARLCHSAGGELEQIQFLLGHASVQTTERYIGCKQNLKEAVNDRFGISVESDAA